MYEISVEDRFSAAHCLREYKGKCEQLHGHNWKVEAAVRARELDEIGLAMDFGDLKGLLKDVLGLLDHSYLNEVEPFDRLNPSSENLARFIFDPLEKKLDGREVEVAKVTAWESEGSKATYSR